MGRRDYVIAEATALLRESGPNALTSVNVAARLGVTQSAIYRHIRDMDELTTLASHAVVGEVTQVMFEAVASPETTWGDGIHIARFAERLVGLIEQHEHAFSTIDRWRYDDGELGDGIRTLLGAGAELVAGELERAWRDVFDQHDPLTDSDRAAQLAHAKLIIDDVIAAARSVHVSNAARRRQAARTLGLRMFVGWCGYVQEMNSRHHLDLPVVGAPMMPSPVGTAPWGAVAR
jgi:AcrR family transcriptional regulator